MDWYFIASIFTHFYIFGIFVGYSLALFRIKQTGINRNRKIRKKKTRSRNLVDDTGRDEIRTKLGKALRHRHSIGKHFWIKVLLF